LENKRIVEGKVGNNWTLEECEDCLLIHNFDSRLSTSPICAVNPRPSSAVRATPP